MKLIVIMLDRFNTHMALQHCDECVPFGRRSVQVDLTPEQIAVLEPAFLGESDGVSHYEEVGGGGVWLEDIPPDPEEASTE